MKTKKNSSDEMDSEIRDDLFGPEHISAESDEDLTGADTASLGSAVVWGTDWTAAAIVDQLRRRNIALDPTFQRRDAWTDERKSRFIESLILGLPIPQLVLAEDRKSKGKFIVIDGKQRLLSLSRFTGVGLSRDQQPLVLTGLKVRKDLNKCTYEDLQHDMRREELIASFENRPIRTVVIRDWKSEGVLYTIFHRLNTGSVPMSTQELRQALHPGPFLTFVAKFSEKSVILRTLLDLTRPDFRMRDVELVVRFFSFQLRLPEYRGNLKQFLDDTCDQFNKAWDTREDEFRSVAGECEQSIKAAIKIFSKNTVYRKWDGERFEKRMNRAIFDVVSNSLAEAEIRSSALKKKEKVQEAFKQLCLDESFRSAIESTTKSKEAVSIRFSKWYRALSHVIGKKISPDL